MHLLATAVIFVDIELAKGDSIFLAKIYQDAGVNYGFFDTEKEARFWLQGILKSDTSNNLVHQSLQSS
jgi:hypothetical protein